MKITLDSDGKVITLDDRNKEIMKNIEPTILNQIAKKEQNMYLKKPFQLKFGSVITNKLLELFRGYDLLSDDDITTLDANDLKDYYLHFMDLINDISKDIELTPTKPLFCAYMGITVKIFNNLAKSKDDALKKWIDAINGDFTHSLFDSSMNGNANEKSALTFASTKEYGQETVQNDFSATIIQRQEIEYTPAQALSRAQATVGLIENLKQEMKKQMKGKRK